MNLALTRSQLIQLGVLVLLFMAFFFRALPLQLDPVRATNAPGQFDTTRAVDRLSRILGNEIPHPVDSDALDGARARMLTEIRDLGFEPEVRDETACRSNPGGASTRCARVQNVFFVAGPRTGPALVLTAHYDSVDASPGAGDDGVGVAVWLEVAKHLADRPPPRPVVFLITDGEETALLGAQVFLDANKYGFTVDRIINLEARGVAGPAMMFETSHPNEAIVSDWAAVAPRPVANSLMTAVYELLPNSTDLTVYLGDNLKGINLAIADRLSFYHSERDDLAMLDRRSVQHMGDQALGSMNTFLGQLKPDRGEIIYSDLIGGEFIFLPQIVGLLTLGLCFGLAALLMMRPARDMDWKKPDWRAFAVPPVVMVAAAALDYAAHTLLGLIRPEPDFWQAWRQPLNCLIFLLAMLATLAALTWIAPKSRREALFASGWFWFLAIGVTLSFFVPGGSILYVIPGVWFVIAGIAARIWPKFAWIAHAVAAFVAWIIYLPLIQLFDVMMGLGTPAAFGFLSFSLFATALALIGPIEKRLYPFALAGAGALAAFILALAAPSHTKDAPLALNIIAHYDLDSTKAIAAAAADPGALPGPIRDRLPGEPAPVIPGITTKMAQRDISFDGAPSITATIESDTSTADARTLQIRLQSPGARFIRLRIPEAMQPIDFTYARYGKAMPLSLTKTGQFIVDCYGRACNDTALTLRLKPAAAPPAEPLGFLVQAYHTGLPAEAAAIARLRPNWAVKLGTGDVSVATKRLPLP